jgi:hypothetical protein
MSDTKLGQVSILRRSICIATQHFFFGGGIQMWCADDVRYRLQRFLARISETFKSLGLYLLAGS